MHPCEDDIVCKCTTDENKVPYFNAPVYLENKEQIGKVDEIFGQLRDFVSFLTGRSKNFGKVTFFFLRKLNINETLDCISIVWTIKDNREECIHLNILDS